MAGDLNRASLIGRLGRDPEIRNTGAGKPVASFSIATSEKWKDKNSGDEKEQTEWHRIACFREATSRFIEHYVKKGDQVYVEGQIKTRKYEKDGVTHYNTEIVITDFNGEVRKLGSSGDGGARPAPDEGAYGTHSSRPSKGGGAVPASMDEDSIPF
jgi:single-strand DNA-binding protein